MPTDMTCCLGPLEKEVLDIIWTEDCPSVRCVLLKLNKSRKKNEKLAYTTVMTIMKRLLSKKILTREKKGRSYLYQSKETKDEFVKKVTQCTIKNLTNRFGELAIKSLREELK